MSKVIFVVSRDTFCYILGVGGGSVNYITWVKEKMLLDIQS